MKLINPLRLLLISGAIWLTAYLSLPARYINLGGGALLPIISLLLYNVLFIAGLSTIKSINVKRKDITKRKKQALLFVLFCLGTVGVLIRVYQRYFVQNIYFAEDLTRTRMELMASEGGSGMLGVLSAFLYPFATVALMLAILWAKSINKLVFFTIFSVGIFPIYDSILTESRLLIVLTSCLIAFTFLGSNIRLFKSITVIKFRGVKILNIPSILLKKKVLIPILILFIGFVIFSKSVINNRLETFSYRDTLKVWEYYHDSEMNEDFVRAVNLSNNKIEKNKLIAGYSLKHYMAHSVFEYIRLVNHLDKSYGYYYGLFEFYTYVKFLRILGIEIPSFSEMNKVSYKPAVYTTFWGPFYIDFGVIGFFISFLMGRFFKRVYLKAKAGLEGAIILYAFVGTVILASFFVNFAMGGNLYFLTSIAATCILLHFCTVKVKFR